METVFEDPYIFMTTKPISTIRRTCMPLLDQVMKAPRPLVILAEKVDGAALGMLVAQQPARDARGRRGARARASGTAASQHLGDLAAFTGGEVIAEEAGLTLDDVAPRVLRHARGA